MIEPPSPEALKLFDEVCVDAAEEAVEFFHFLGLPDGDQLAGLTSELKVAIANVMRDWL